ncbi:MAG: MFS transporter [Thermoplasmata archaeon]|jgi:MFS family permease|nr:MFS transporter [Euryarchaeota archaeon]MVT35518.1 MFS transporter [Euryarchaeota archaeon]
MNGYLKKIIASRALLSYSYGFLNVLLSLYLKSLGFSFLSIGIILGTAIIINAILALFLSMIADHYGRRNFLIILFVFFSISAFLFLYTKNLFILALLSGLGGFTGTGGGPIGSGGPFGAIQSAMITEYTKRENFSKILGIASAIGMISSVLGSFTITAVEIFGINVYLLFYIASILGILAAGITVFIKDTGLRSKHILPKISWRNIIKLSLPTIPSGIGAGLINPIFSLWFSLRFHLTPGQIGIIFGIANIFTTIMMLLIPMIIKKESELKTIVWSRVIGSISLLLIAFSPFMLLTALLYILRNGFQMGAIPIRQSFSMGIVDETERATSSGVTSFTRTGFSSLSPPISGNIIAYSIELPPLLSGLITLLDPILYYLLFKNKI